MRYLIGSGRGFRDHFRQEAEEGCREERVDRLESHRRARDAFLPGLQGALSAPQLEEETETDLMVLVESLLGAGASPVWVLTDGIDTVHEGELGLDPADGQRVVLVLVPAREEYGGRGAAERAAVSWRAVAVEAIPYVDLS